MNNDVHIIFKNIIQYIRDPLIEIQDIECHLYKMVKSFYDGYEPEIIEWVTSHVKTHSGATTHSDSFIFKQHKIVIAYNRHHLLSDYVNIFVAVLRDVPKPDLSIRRAMFIFDSSSETMMEIDNEIFKP